MEHLPNIRLVNTHPERNGARHDVLLGIHELVLDRNALVGGDARVVGGGGDVVALEVGDDVLGLLLEGYVDDGRTGAALEHGHDAGHLFVKVVGVGDL